MSVEKIREETMIFREIVYSNDNFCFLSFANSGLLDLTEVVAQLKYQADLSLNFSDHNYFIIK